MSQPIRVAVVEDQPTLREGLATLIEDYRVGRVPLVVPVTMLKHHFADHPDAYINQQTFLEPYPDDLRLRNLL